MKKGRSSTAPLATSGPDLRALTLALLVACSAETEPPRAPSHTVPGPATVLLDRSQQEVAELLRKLLAAARREPAAALRRGELGMAYEVNGFPEAALASYVQAESLDPADGRWPYFQARIHGGRGEQAEALLAVDRALAVHARYAPAWVWKGVWSLDLGRLEEADAAFRQAESLGLGVRADLGRARVLLRRRLPAEAVLTLEQTLETARSSDIYQLLGRAYREAGRIDDARIALARSKSAAPLRVDDGWQAQKRQYEVVFIGRLNNAQELHSLGEVDAAIAILEDLIEQQPTNRMVVNSLSIAYRQTGDVDRGFWLIRRALEKDPKYDGYHYNISSYYYARGDIDSALESLERAIELNPGKADPYFRKGMLLMQRAEFENALAAFEGALEVDPSNARVYHYAGRAEARLKRWRSASRRFDQAVHIDPSFAGGYLDLAGSLAQEARFDDARAALERAQYLGIAERRIEAAMRELVELEQGRQQ